MRWSHPDEEPAVRTVIPSQNTAAKREAIRWAREREAKVGSGILMWAIGLPLWVSMRKRDTLPIHGVTKIAVFSDSQVAI
jgi:hypothetical protein